MKSHPIIFSAPMVCAILEGRKTQTRRVIKPQPIKLGDIYEDASKCYRQYGAMLYWQDGDEMKCPYGAPGDLLWARETWQFVGIDMNRNGRTHWIEDAVVRYKDETHRTIEVDWKIGEKELLRHNHWRPSIHMPRWASRITLRIMDVRVQRLQEITEDDAKAEGISGLFGPGSYKGNHYMPGFQLTWDSINAKRGYSFESNPWVFAIGFEKIKEGGLI